MRLLISTLTVMTLALVGACASSGSRGGPRVVVMPIAGSDSADDAVSQAVERRYELVSDSKYKRAASRLDAKSKDSDDVRRVSRKLDIDAVVSGEMVKKGRKKYELRLVLRAGDSGEEFDSIKIKLRSKKLKKDDLRKVRKKLYSALAVVDTWERDDDDDRASSSRSRRTSSTSSKREMDRARKLRKKKHDKSRRDEDRRAERDAERDQERDKEERKRAEKERRKKEEKLARRRAEEEDDDRDDEDDFEDEDDDDRESRKKSKKKKKKSKKKDETYEVVTVRDSSGQAIDEEDPF